MNKNLITIIALIFSNFVFSQENSVTIIGFGDGKTRNEATNAALRQCIEKTFGVFVSTNSQVVNDQLVKDEIATISSGNIMSYDIISELEKSGNYLITVSAVVSPENIVKSYKSKGYSFEINGNIYAQNILKEKFYKEQEPKIIEDFLSKYIDYPIFDSFDLKVGEPFVGITDLNVLKNKVRNQFTKYSKIGVVSLSYFGDIVGGNSIKNIYDILPNNLFSTSDRSDATKYLYMWESIIGSKVIYSNKDIDTWQNPNLETYIIPIIYSPHYNEENAFNLSEILINFFNKICIRNNEYESKFGQTFTTSLCLIKGSKNKKGYYQRSGVAVQDFKLRNPKSIDLITKFSEQIGIKSNPNSLTFVDLAIKLKLNSGWFYQPYQNFINPIHNTDILKSSKIHLNLADGLLGLNGFKFNYRPCLLLLNVTEDELSKLNKLEFKWK